MTGAEKQPLAGVALAALAMSVGWGVRGDYGHEAGAMIPGALLGLAVCCASGREDWWRRAGVMGLCGAIGWAFGGQMSYGRIVGYTAAPSFVDVAYGYGSLFVVGGLWGGVGAGVLALSLTEPRSYLERFVRPLAVLWLAWLLLDWSGATRILVERWDLNDTDWVAALSALAVAAVWARVSPRDRPACGLIALLAAGWWTGYLLLVAGGGLRMTPPRGDNWAGCVGLFVALVLWLGRRNNRAGLMLAGYGFLFGGLGFMLGDFAQMLGRAGWGPMAPGSILGGLDYWKWMEQLFGLVMGLGLALVFLGSIRSRLAPASEDTAETGLDTFATFFLLVIMMWSNLQKNARTWAREEHLPEHVLGLDPRVWLTLIGALLAVGTLRAILMERRGELQLMPKRLVGRAQLLFLLVLWIPVVAALLQASPGLADAGSFFVHVTFWIGGATCLLLLLAVRTHVQPESTPQDAATDAQWSLGLKYWLSLALIPFLAAMLGYLTLASHVDELPGSHRRFAHRGSPQGQGFQSPAESFRDFPGR